MRLNESFFMHKDRLVNGHIHSLVHHIYQVSEKMSHKGYILLFALLTIHSENCLVDLP